MKTKIKKLEFRCHVPNLLKLISDDLNHMNSHLTSVPLSTFSQLLSKVADRATELNDDKLNKLMCQMALYEESDPESKNYNKELMREILYGDKK